MLPLITAGVAFHHSWCCLSSELVLPLITAGVAFHQSWCCLSSELVLPFIRAGVAFHHSWFIKSKLIQHLQASRCILTFHLIMHRAMHRAIYTAQACRACQQHVYLCSGQHQTAVKKHQIVSKAKSASVLHFKGARMMHASCW